MAGSNTTRWASAAEIENDTKTYRFQPSAQPEDLRGSQGLIRDRPDFEGADKPSL